MSMIDVLLGKVGLASAGLVSKLNIAERDLRQQLTQLNTELLREKDDKKSAERRVVILSNSISELKKEKAQSERELHLTKKQLCALRLHQVWCRPELVFFPETPKIQNYSVVPQRLKDATQAAASELLKDANGSIVDLCYLGRVKSPALWCFYWALAHAAHSATQTADAHSNEDGITDVLLSTLAQQVESIEKSTGLLAPVELGVSAIYRNNKPALKEEVVGADALLVIAGKGLLPKGGARLVWIQAKLANAAKPYQLDFWRPQNKNGFQFDAIRAMHLPQSGSYAIYVQYVPNLPLITSLSVGQMPYQAPLTAKHSVVNLLDHDSCRLQEQLSLIAGSNQLGQFADAKAVRAFLDTKTKNSLVPIRIISVCARDDGEGRNLVQEVKKYYDLALDNAPSRDRGHGLDISM